MTEMGILFYFPPESKAMKPLSVGAPSFNAAVKVQCRLIRMAKAYIFSLPIIVFNLLHFAF